MASTGRGLQRFPRVRDADFADRSWVNGTRILRIAVGLTGRGFRGSQLGYGTRILRIAVGLTGRGFRGSQLGYGTRISRIPIGLRDADFADRSWVNGTRISRIPIGYETRDSWIPVGLTGPGLEHLKRARERLQQLSRQSPLSQRWSFDCSGAPGGSKRGPFRLRSQTTRLNSGRRPKFNSRPTSRSVAFK
jgi:hypothetical protein